MSKSAIKSLKTAESLIAVAGVVVNLVGYLDAMNRVAKDGKKAWRNADNLACLIINSVANAFQCEDAESMKENGFKDMVNAIESYVESNLDDWTGYQTKGGWMNKDSKIELDRLMEMVNRNIAYQQREAKRIAQSAVIESESLPLLVEACHTHALQINAEIDEIVNFAGDDKPVQIDGDVNWIFDAALVVWNRKTAKDKKPEFESVKFSSLVVGDTILSDITGKRVIITRIEKGFTDVTIMVTDDGMMGTYQDRDLVVKVTYK